MQLLIKFFLHYRLFMVVQRALRAAQEETVTARSIAAEAQAQAEALKDVMQVCSKKHLSSMQDISATFSCLICHKSPTFALW
jgi:hypothetical protein